MDKFIYFVLLFNTIHNIYNYHNIKSLANHCDKKFDLVKGAFDAVCDDFHDINKKINEK